MKLRVGIAGYGLVGKRRRSIIDLHPKLKTVAVCDRTFASDGVLEDGLRYYNNFEKLLEEELDVLFVCLTHDVAPSVTIAGLEKNLHVFCEKPPGRSVEDIKSVIRVEKKHPHLKLKFGFNHRYHDSVKEAIRLVHSKELGEMINLRGVYGKSAIVGAHGDWRSKRAIAGGGILLDQGIHMLDLMVAFAGPFDEVKSYVCNSHWNHDVEDNAYAIMKSKSGVIGMLHSTATQWRHRFSLEISLARGAVLLQGILSSTKSYGQETLTVVKCGSNDCGNPREIITNFIEDNSWKEEIFDFAENVLQDSPVTVGTSADALQAMEHVFRIYVNDPNWQKKYEISL